MARGSAPGEHRGGRKPGVPNKKTQEALLKQAMEKSDAVKSGRKLAREVLDEFMHLTAGMAAFYQPAPPNAPPNQNANEDKFWRCVDATHAFAKALAPYQSPTFKAIAMMAPPEPPRRAELPGGNVVSLDDPEALTRVYKRRIASVG